MAEFILENTGTEFLITDVNEGKKYVIDYDHQYVVLDVYRKATDKELNYNSNYLNTNKINFQAPSGTPLMFIRFLLNNPANAKLVGGRRIQRSSRKVKKSSNRALRKKSRSSKRFN